jgi:aminomethyltransferase
VKHTSLLETHRALDAKLVDFAGWSMPVQYGPILDEVRCVRERVGLFDLGHMGRIFVGGPDAVPFLDSVATNYVARIPVGAIRYSVLCTEDGGSLDDLLLYREEDGVYAVINASNTEVDLDWLAAHAEGFDVDIEDRTEATAMLALQGPHSEAVLARLYEGGELSELGYYKFTRGDVAGLADVHVSRTGYTGEDGFELTFPTAEGPRVWAALIEAGAPQGIAPIGLGARDVLRLEAGMALYGHELDREHDPIQAGLSVAVSFKEEKGDWVGRAALAAIKAAPRRRLIGLTTPGPRIPRQRAPVFDGDQEVGAVCSGAPSPTLETNIATAYLTVDRAVAGAALELDFRGRRQPCTVQELPFFSRTRK